MNSIRWWTGAAILALVLGINQFPSNGADDDKTNKDKDKSTQSSIETARSAFMGVMVEELHPAFASHMPGAGAKGQGLLVEAVGSDSPASKAGIKVHDILMTYDDQKLLSPDQFVKLVGNDKSGREVSLGLIREGKSQTMKVKLGERTDGWHHHHGWQNGSPKDGNRNFEGAQARRIQSGPTSTDTDNPIWNSFDSMTLKKVAKDRFHASIAYTDKDGKLKKHEYEGTREEIQNKIEADKDLMANERNHLERGLDLGEEDGPNFPFPGNPRFDF